tara:strand:+ start:3350 stop:3667 length:318 start_codon:yes stop_codon:yes gene_type:complete
MVKQMVGSDVAVESCGGTVDSRLGTDVAAIRACLDLAWNPPGIAVLFDLGSARMNAEMAISMCPAEQQERIVVCDAPIVEGALLAASEASLGSDLNTVRAAAEDA